MDLARHGLRWAIPSLDTTAVATNGQHLRLSGRDPAKVDGPLSPEDRLAWAELSARLVRFAAVLRPFRDMPPPRLAKGAGNDVWSLAKIGLRARMMGKAEFRELLRMFLTNTYDVLNDDLSDPLLKGTLAFDASLGTWLGPRSPNSLLPWLDRMSGGGLRLPAGGMGVLATTMRRAAEAAGVVIRSDAAVARAQVNDGRATGVVLHSGEEISAPLVVSAISPKATLVNLVGPRHLDTGLITRARHQKARGGAAKLHLALSGLPDFRGADLKTRLVLAPSEEHVERAFNPVKYGQVPDAPVMEVLVPSAIEPGHAPAGQHLLTAVVQYAPHDPTDRDGARAAMLQATLAQLEVHAPGMARLITAAELLMPYDIERIWGLPGGNWHAGELSIEQMLFLRPLPGLSQYQTPVRGLWMASAGCHPGGGVSGTPGWNAGAAIERAGE
jgi:phytoene dehydrogenase-like protein